MLASRRANCVRSFQFIEAPTDVYYIYFLLLCVCVCVATDVGHGALVAVRCYCCDDICWFSALIEFHLPFSLFSYNNSNINNGHGHGNGNGTN